MQIKMTVPSLYQNGLAVEALAVTPSTTHSAIGSSLKARLAAQDMADSLRARLSLYPRSKGLAPLSCLAPEFVHASDEFRYVFISGPTWWRHELAELSIRSGKDVALAPPRTKAEALELAELADMEGRRAVLYNELRFAPAMGALHEVIHGDGSDGGFGEGALGPASELRIALTLSPPLCCSEGHPTKEDREAPKSWWRSRALGGGALGVAGVQAFELVQYLAGSHVQSVRTKALGAGGGEGGEGGEGGGFAADLGGEGADYAPDYGIVEVKMTNGATAELTLDWRDSAPSAAEMTKPFVRVEGSGGCASLDLLTGQLELRSARPEEGDPEVLIRGEGPTHLVEVSHGALAHALMLAQQSDGEEEEGGVQVLSEAELGEVLCTDWHGSVARSFDAAEATYKSWDTSRGEGWYPTDCERDG
jgi:predicted dehydrogenase